MGNYVVSISIVLFVMYWVSVNFIYRFLWLSQFEDLLREKPYPTPQKIRDRLDAVAKEGDESVYRIIAILFPLWLIPFIFIKALTILFKSILNILENIK